LEGEFAMVVEKPEKKIYSFRFDENLVDELKLHATKENRSFSNFVETILKSYLKENTQIRA
jgi:hypothetical protein